MIKMMNWKSYVCLLAVALLAVGGVGCKTNGGDDAPTDFDTASGSDTGSGVSGGDPDGPLPTVDQQNILFPPHGADSPLKSVYFDFDSSSLRPDALAALRDNAELMQQYSDVYIQIAGHCDERGTQEYNLALGERRALTVRSHLIQLGVRSERLLTITYGEELPAVSGNSEAAYSKNRRCEFNMASSQ